MLRFLSIKRSLFKVGSASVVVVSKKEVSHFKEQLFNVVRDFVLVNDTDVDVLYFKTD